MVRELYIITCATCKQAYNHRVYDDADLIIEQKQKPTGSYLEKVSHGICETCLPLEMEKLDLEFKIMGEKNDTKS